MFNTIQPKPKYLKFSACIWWYMCIWNSQIQVNVFQFSGIPIPNAIITYKYAQVHFFTFSVKFHKQSLKWAVQESFSFYGLQKKTRSLVTFPKQPEHKLPNFYSMALASDQLLCNSHALHFFIAEMQYKLQMFVFWGDGRTITLKVHFFILTIISAREIKHIPLCQEVEGKIKSMKRSIIL